MVASVVEELITFVFETATLFQNLERSQKNPFDTPENSNLFNTFAKTNYPSTLFLIQSEFGTDLKAELPTSFDSAVAVIKQKEPLTSQSPISSQINVLNIPNTSQTNFDTIRSLISLGISPYFDLLTRQNDQSSVLAVKKKINELSITLQNFQLSIATPDLLSTIHPKLIRFQYNDIESVPESLLGDSTLLNELTSIANNWIKQIQSVTSLQHSPLDGDSIMEETSFWRSIGDSLGELSHQLNDPRVKLTLEILKRAKRYHVTMSFNNETGLEDKIHESANINSLLKEFTFDDMFSISSTNPTVETLTVFQEAISIVFSQFRKLKNFPNYPISRSIDLVEVVLKDICFKFVEILSNFYLMSLSFDNFKIIIKECQNIFMCIEESIISTTNLIRELLRKRQEKFVIVKVEQKGLIQLKEKLEHLDALRLKHINLLRSIEVTDDLKSTINSDLALKLVDAYNQFIIPVNAVDISVYASNVWNSNESIYTETFRECQSSVITKINEKLDHCRSFNDYLSVISSTNNGGHDISQYINEDHKVNCLTQVEAEIESLLLESRQSSKILSDLSLYYLGHGLTTSSRDANTMELVYWMISLRNSAEFYQSSLESVFGDQWHEYSIGKKIQTEIASVLANTSLDETIESWIQSTSKLIEGLLLLDPLIRVDSERGNRLRILLSFDYTYIQLFDETHQLMNLGFKIPKKIIAELSIIENIYPFVINLQDQLHKFSNIIEEELVESNYGKKLSFILDSHIQEIYDEIEHLMSITWSLISSAVDMSQMNDKDENFSREIKNLTNLDESKCFSRIKSFNEKISNFFDLVSSLRNFYVNFTSLMKTLENCDFEHCAIEETLINIQQLATQFCYGGFQNVDKFYEILNNDVADVIFRKIQFQFDNIIKVKSEFVKKSKLEILYLDLEFLLSPLIDSYKSLTFKSIDLIMNLATNHRILSGSDINERFTSFVTSNNVLACPVYDHIDSIAHEAEAYFSQWIVLQGLWETSLTDLDEEHGSDFAAWLLFFTSIQHSRQLFDTSGSSFIIGEKGGALEVDYSIVQSKISMKFDEWHYSICKHFSDILGQAIKQSWSTLKKLHKSCEEPINFGSTTSIISSINSNAEFNQTTAHTEVQLDKFFSGQTYLLKHKFKLDRDWMHVEQLQNKLSELKTLEGRKSSMINDHKDLISPRLSNEGKKIDERIKQLIDNWKEEKPISGTTDPTDAIDVLYKYKKSYHILEVEKQQLYKACESLRTEVVMSQDVSILREEVEDLLDVWVTLDELWQRLESLQNTKWMNSSSRSIRKDLDDILNSARSTLSRIRQYPAFDVVLETLKSYVSCHKIVTDLKNDFIQQRHWFQIANLVSVNLPKIENMTYGNVWELNLLLHENSIKAIINQAMNESVIEENIKDIENVWSTITFDMFTYKGRHRLVKGWDVLFEQCSNDLVALSNMRNSAYFATFEIQVTELESKLNNLYSLLDSWIESQKEWMYLDGVFGLDNDLAQLLPVEKGRFNNISHEFFEFLKQAARYDLVLNILKIPDAQTTIDQIFESLKRIRNSLSDYLEKQRELFPRFYFIGNEDLLQIIGSGNDVKIIGKNIASMYPSIRAIEYRDENNSIVSISGDMDERIVFRNPISLLKFPKLHQWLHELECELKQSLILLTYEAVKELKHTNEVSQEFILKFPFQILNLSFRIVFTERMNNMLQKDIIETENNYKILDSVMSHLDKPISTLERKKCESLITELLRENDILNSLQKMVSKLEKESFWNRQLQYNLSDNDKSPKLVVEQAGSNFDYGFEYLGVTENLAHTPLTNQCYLVLTQALNQGLGGSPFGPAGTGKTETVKALGQHLGRMVLVFCCDEFFDYQSMGRIFLGLCKVGAWGCFDEFNRLEERIMSALSSLIETIESSLIDNTRPINLLGKSLKVHPHTGLFITMNPTYAGRSELPENLKRLFRSISMDIPDSKIIIEVLLTSSGFRSAAKLASQMVEFFNSTELMTLNQIHYDFGLRAIKRTLISCGQYKLLSSLSETEEEIVIKAIKDTIFPKLIKNDVSQVEDLLTRHFGGGKFDSSESEVSHEIKQIMANNDLVASDEWITKCLQLRSVQDNSHGIILVGEAGSGKSTSWKYLLEALSNLESRDHSSYVIDCKVLSKDDIYGSLDSVTREWTDGLFTGILRRIVQNSRGEMNKRTWIIFDGDMDPDWVENLNSVLDDNKVLTLPNGERLHLPSNVRLIFETDDLSHATPATISRCGMIWYDYDTLPLKIRYGSMFNQLKKFKIDDVPRDFIHAMVNEIERQLDFNTFEAILIHTQKYHHVMEWNTHRYIESFGTLLRIYIRKYSKFRSGFQNLESGITRVIFLAIMWTFGGDCSILEREELGNYVSTLAPFISLQTNSGGSCMDLDIDYSDGSWRSWAAQVEEVHLEPHQVTETSTVVPTLDTVIHEDLIYLMLNEHRPFILCGPPGSGKTMILLEALRKSPDLDILSLNFSKETSPELLLRSIEQFCKYKKLSTGLSLAPKVTGKWVVVFCDEINLPQEDNYGTQTVISFLRQMVEQNGFWRPSDKTWVTLSNILFVGACNPPTDPGRNVLSNRFLRHASLIMVDYPGEVSMKQIYQSFMLAILKYAPDLRGFALNITDAMINVYMNTKSHLTSAIQDHYIYSPREVSRWVKGILEALKSHQYTSLEEFLRLWYHEGLRLFYDRLVHGEEQKWTKKLFEDTLHDFFPHLHLLEIMKSPIYFSNWLSNDYELVDRDELMSFIRERLRVFSEEDVEVDLILYDEMLDHILRIDRVLRQPQGHAILVGPSSSGKSTLTRFVSWIYGIKVIQLNVFTGFTIRDFDSILRSLLLSCVSGEKICFMIDESCIIETTFIERMNTLLANAEIPGLFEGDEFNTLMKNCQDESNKLGLYLDTNDELYSWFTGQVTNNLHIVFTISDTTTGVLTSPALFNRCVLNWMGEWSDKSVFQISKTLVDDLPFDLSNYSIPQSYESFSLTEMVSFRDVIADCLVGIYQCCKSNSFVFPNTLLQFVNEFKHHYTNTLKMFEETQNHTQTGLDKLRETVITVNSLKEELSIKKDILQQKDKEAREMLDFMLTNQNEAERKREFSVEMRQQLQIQEEEISSRRNSVLEDLSLAEPAVLEAQKGVQNIKKQHLTELRSMSNPPAAVKMTLESVCILLGYDVNSWREVQLVVRKDDFIANIVCFDTEKQLLAEQRSYMEQTYLSRNDFNYETVNRASKACGPLVQWVLANLTYSSVLDRIGPLKEEVINLEMRANKTKSQLIAIEDMIKELEESIEIYKKDYSEVIRSTENIKSQITSITTKVERSSKLVSNLTRERERWKQSISNSSKDQDVLIGNAILGAAFIAYCGDQDSNNRKELLNSWKHILDCCGIPFDKSIDLSIYLSKNLDDIETVEVDKLYQENFTLVKSSSIPFLIDPTLVSIKRLQEKCEKLIVTSFLDSNFVQQLESAIKFGGTILIQNAELYNPIINSILRKDIFRQGGRLVIKIKGQPFDYSESFRLILHTRDTQIRVLPFVLARSNRINFSMTSATLENNVLELTLREKQPDIQQKRNDLIELRRNYKRHLFDLENKLLLSLGETSSNILNDDKVLADLEKIKIEAGDIDIKMDESEAVFQSIEGIREEYQQFAEHCSTIFGILEKLHSLNCWYQITMDEFIQVYYKILKSSNRDDIIIRLYREIFYRFSISLSDKHKAVLAICLAISYHSKIEEITKGDILKVFRQISSDIADENIEIKVSDVNFMDLLIKHVTNKESKLIDGFKQFTLLLFQECSWLTSKYDFNDVIIEYHEAKSPILLVSPEDLDPTFQIVSLGHKLDRRLKIISMGSEEGILDANTEIQSAMYRGDWIVLQNVQMSSNWLHVLVQKLENTQLSNIHTNFKLFLTTNIGSQLSSTLVSQSMVIMFDSEPGIKKRFQNVFESIPDDLMNKNPRERRHLYFLLTWFHCFVQEKSVYVPKTFKQKCDINSSDFKAGLHAIEAVLSKFNPIKEHVPPDHIPWGYLSYMIAHVTYGSKFINPYDFQLLRELADQIFTAKSFELDFDLAINGDLHPPEGVSDAVYSKWISELPQRIPLEWIGLNPTAHEETTEEELKEVAVIVCEISEE